MTTLHRPYHLDYPIPHFITIALHAAAQEILNTYELEEDFIAI